MKKEQAQDHPDPKDATGMVLTLAWGVSSITEIALDFGHGTTYLNWLLVPGGVTWVAWLAIYPQYTGELAPLAVGWLALWVLHKIIASARYMLGRCGDTRYIGTSVFELLIPHAVARRWGNPLFLFFISDQFSCPAVRLLLKVSAAGQALVFFYIDRANRADEEARWNAQQGAR